jgi:hypothetical protein
MLAIIWPDNLAPRLRCSAFGGLCFGDQFAGRDSPALRTSLSAFLSTYVFAGCSFAKKLNTTNAAQNSNPTSITFR